MSTSTVTVATCSLNQWAMDFQGNLNRVKQSIQQAKQQQARYRLGPELEISGYGCEDHFLELDTFIHTWECIAELISEGYSDDIVLDIGGPVMHRDVAYNCRILILNREILLVRPKITFADDGNYREPRWFTPWDRHRALEQLILPPVVRNATSSKKPHCPIGQAVIEFYDGVAIGCESCEELWSPMSTHLELYMEGVHIVGNASGSHHSLRKLNDRLELIKSATRKCGGAYLYSNQIGCDGGRLYYDGSAVIALNGSVLKQGSQFALHTEVEVLTATIETKDITAYRREKACRGVQAADARSRSHIPRIHPTGCFQLINGESGKAVHPTEPLLELIQFRPEEEIARGPACWLWDYLRRSGMNGFFLPLSGGADSSSSAVIVGSMCQMLVDATNSGHCEERLLNEIRRVTQTNRGYVPKDARELANRILHTVYLGSKGSSSVETKHRAAALSEEIGAWHASVDIHAVVESAINVFVSVFGTSSTPRFKVHGGSNAENLARQNLQARIRMVLSYLFAQLLLWARVGKGSLLVLGSANVDEGLRGYLTKYDCSSADLNPIGGISKTDLRRFLRWAATDEGLGYGVLKDVVDAPPTAELEPLTESYVQTDEEDMGMTYEELSWFGRLRKLGRCGPYNMYIKLASAWKDRSDIHEIAQRVKFFFRMYSINRHKLTTLTPSYHAEDYSPEDNRFDLRQFLYNVRWTWQFQKIDEDVAERQTRTK
ncbi:glutamine-dependent NAD synthetase [Gracilaria domingensis]|nr:glutamine-dependent NAD synthetase [Gracilaria domingensis]